MRYKHEALRDIIKSLPRHIDIYVAVENASTLARLETEAAVNLLQNEPPAWRLVIRDNGDDAHVIIACDADEAGVDLAEA